MKVKKKKILLSVLGILLLVLATVGVTFAVFTYTKLGTTENTVTTGTLKFLYTENTGVGNGINIENAFPVSDEVGKGYNTDKYVFDFSVEATNSGTEEIPYEVTLRKKDTSTVPEKNIKVYLTDMTDDSDTSIVAPILYSGLTQTTIDVGNEIEKTIYNGTVLGGELTYKKDFRLRMWIDEKSNQEDINGKTFTALVNVYSNVPLVSEEELASRDSVEISGISFEESIAIDSKETGYDFLLNVPIDTKDITLNIDTANPYATVEVEKLDSISKESENIIRTSITKTFSISNGDNYFKVTVTSASKQVIKEYILKVCPIDTDNTLKTLNIPECMLTPNFGSETLSYKCTVNNSVSKVSINAETNSKYAKIEGLGEKSLVVGNNFAEIKVTAQNGDVKIYTISITRRQPTLESTDALTVGTAVTLIDGSSWYVLEASAAGTDTVVLLSAYNLKSDGSYDSSCTRICSPRQFDPDNTNTYDENDSNNIAYFLKNTYAPILLSSMPDVTNITLPTQEQLYLAAGKTYTVNHDGSFYGDQWLIATDYWTKTAKTTDKINLGTMVGHDKYFSFTTANNNQLYGARPVITTPKTNIAK